MSFGKIVIKSNGKIGITKVKGYWSAAIVAIVIGDLIARISGEMNTSPEHLLDLVTSVAIGSKDGEDHERKEV